MVCKFECCGIFFIKRDIQPRGISAKVECIGYVPKLSTDRVGENGANWQYMTTDP